MWDDEHITPVAYAQDMELGKRLLAAGRASKAQWREQRDSRTRAALAVVKEHDNVMRAAAAACACSSASASVRGAS